MPPAKITPEWIKVHKSMSASMKELAVMVKALDTHFEGKLMALKAQEAQDGPFRKVLTTLRTDTKMVRKALEANKTKKNEDEVEGFISLIDGMFSEGSEVWETHKGIMDEKKSNAFAKDALKKWNDQVKKAKDKMVKKIVSKSKTPTLLPALSKTLVGVAAAQRAFMGHNAKFNKANLFLGKGIDKVAKELPKVAVALKKAKVAADKMDKVAM